MSDDALLELFEGLRLADVRDGLDALGYHYRCSMDPSIRPLWRTSAVGIARTCRYLPYRGTVPRLDEKGYAEWSGWYYGHVCPYPWVDQLRPGDFVVIDASGVDAGLMGSENTLACVRRGARGFVTNGGVRDTDEVIRQRVPFWSAMVSKSMVQGRLQFESMGGAVCVGGVTVQPGDVVVADGDGVVVVPREAAEDAARLAREENRRDRAARRAHYEALGLPPDETVV
ncbi:MAG: RraA family protein [Fimbriimonadales bacterium]|nr:RraA family protein [Fimbriimonadales bacterium]